MGMLQPEQWRISSGNLKCFYSVVDSSETDKYQVSFIQQLTDPRDHVSSFTGKLQNHSCSVHGTIVQTGQRERHTKASNKYSLVSEGQVETPARKTNQAVTQQVATLSKMEDHG